MMAQKLAELFSAIRCGAARENAFFLFGTEEVMDLSQGRSGSQRKSITKTCLSPQWLGGRSYISISGMNDPRERSVLGGSRSGPESPTDC